MDGWDGEEVSKEQNADTLDHPPRVTTRANDSNAAERQQMGKAGRYQIGPAYRLFGIAPIALAVKAEEMSARM